MVAASRAILSAVGELGGARAWLRFFADHRQALESLDQMGALPENALPIHRCNHCVGPPQCPFFSTVFATRSRRPGTGWKPSDG